MYKFEIGKRKKKNKNRRCNDSNDEGEKSKKNDMNHRKKDERYLKENLTMKKLYLSKKFPLGFHFDP